MIIGTFEVQAVTNYKIKPKKNTNKQEFFFFFSHSDEQNYNTPLVSLHSTFLCVSFPPSSTCSAEDELLAHLSCSFVYRVGVVQ